MASGRVLHTCTTGVCRLSGIILNPDARPAIWRRTELRLDQGHIGLTFESFDDVPPDVLDVATSAPIASARAEGEKLRRYPEPIREVSRPGVPEITKNRCEVIPKQARTPERCDSHDVAQLRPRLNNVSGCTTRCMADSLWGSRVSH